MTHQEKVQHLYWRAGFGRSPGEWKAQENQSLSTIINQLFKAAQNTRELSTSTDLISREMASMNEASKKEIRKKAKRQVLLLNQEWIERMANPDHPVFLEKMTLFWHGHFACTTKQPHLASQQMQAIRQHALGNFRDLVLAIAKDVSMIRFLNNQQNKKRKPNENFARELMELFTIGRGNYTEQDIKEAARAFTGWSSNLRGEFKFRRRQHDYGSKTFMGKTGNFGGEDIIDMLLERRETAQFICRKIYRYFVNEKVNEQRVLALAADFYQSNYDIAALMRQIFSSDWFYAPENVGVKIKSPVELLVGMMRSLDVQFTNSKGILFVQKALGQILFKPPNVAGWPGGKSWIDNSTLMLRLNLANYLFKAAEVNFRVKDEFEATQRTKAIRRMEAITDFQPLLDLFGHQSETAIFADLSQYCLQRPIQLKQTDLTPFLARNSQETYIKSVVLRLMSTPEYQLC